MSIGTRACLMTAEIRPTHPAARIGAGVDPVEWRFAGAVALRSTDHHRPDTSDAWVLRWNGQTDEDRTWSSTPLPPFGQSPWLGLDRPEHDRHRRPRPEGEQG